MIDYKKLLPREYNSKVKLKTKELLNSIEDERDLSETRVFTIPFSANYIEKEKVDKIKKSKKSKVIDDEIL